MSKKQKQLIREQNVTLAKAIEINQWCAQILHSSIFGGKLSGDLARLADDTEEMTRWFFKLKDKLKVDINKELELAGKLPVTGRALDKRIEEKLKEHLEDETPLPKKLRIPLIKESDLEADRDYPHLNIKEGDTLVPIGFRKAMIQWIEKD